MSLAQAMLAEFEAQAPVTRRFLERLPEDKLTWKPHEKSMSAGQLALHLARVPGGVVRFVQQNPAQALDFANSLPKPASRQEILNTHDESTAAVRNLVPRSEFMRDIMLNHWYRHRGQFSVYLRMLNVECRQTEDPAPTSRRPSCRRRNPLSKRGCLQAGLW